ncbi:hypothetical protein C8Q80DRAFT_651059 [Daedaleopsis nitida]|nr:hypothetical protein C8Q80DRAFT_651059 [Daedaleopsis nitida]
MIRLTCYACIPRPHSLGVTYTSAQAAPVSWAANCPNVCGALRNAPLTILRYPAARCSCCRFLATTNISPKPRLHHLSCAVRHSFYCLLLSAPRSPAPHMSHFLPCFHDPHAPYSLNARASAPPLRPPQIRKLPYLPAAACGVRHVTLFLPSVPMGHDQHRGTRQGLLAPVHQLRPRYSICAHARAARCRAQTPPPILDAPGSRISVHCTHRAHRSRVSQREGPLFVQPPVAHCPALQCEAAPELEPYTVTTVYY